MSMLVCGLAEAQPSVTPVDTIRVDSGAVYVSTGTSGEVDVTAEMPAGAFSLRGDPVEMTAWVDRAEGQPADLHGAQIFEADSMVRGVRTMQLLRLSPDSASAYQLEASNGVWAGALTLPDTAARHLFVALYNPKGPPPAEARPPANSRHQNAAARASALTPAYPEELRQQGITGGVLMQFVVDTTGRVDPRTIAVLRSTHPLFALAVRQALPNMKYRPATIDGRRVRQLVQEPFAFGIAPAALPWQPFPRSRPPLSPM
jgi:TonB family protein